MQDPDPKCRHFVISWHFMAFWHVCQKANCITKSAFSAFSRLFPPFRLFHWIRLLDFPALVCKYRADFPPVYLIVLTFVLATKYSWQKQKNPPNKSADCKRTAVRNWICRRNHQQLGGDDLIIIKIITIIDKILIKCLGRSPPLVHCFFDGKYNSVLEKRP